SNKKDYATATANLRKAIDAASADTIYNDAKQNAMYDLANTLSAQYDDTTEYAKIYAPVAANPARYGDQALLNAGVIATQAEKPDDAIKLFSAVVQRNPYQRDALKNLAASYIGAKQPEKVAAVVDKLVALDPNSASNWLLYAYGYSGLLKETKDPKLTKAYTDSLVKYNTKSEKITPNVEIQQFAVDSAAKSATLSGTIENRGAAAKSYTMTVEFLD